MDNIPFYKKINKSLIMSKNKPYAIPLTIYELLSLNSNCLSYYLELCLQTHTYPRLKTIKKYINNITQLNELL